MIAMRRREFLVSAGAVILPRVAHAQRFAITPPDPFAVTEKISDYIHETTIHIGTRMG